MGEEQAIGVKASASRAEHLVTQNSGDAFDIGKTGGILPILDEIFPVQRFHDGPEAQLLQSLDDFRSFERALLAQFVVDDDGKGAVGGVVGNSDTAVRLDEGRE